MEQDVVVTVLGPIGARVGGQVVDLGGPRQRRVLAALSVEPTTSVSPDRLADRVWSDGNLPNDPRRTLRTYLTRLRQALGHPDAVVTADEGWRLHPSVSIDSLILESAVERAADPALDAHRRLAALEEALELFTGRPFGDLAEEDWIRPEAERLDELRTTLVERRFQAMLDAGKHTDAVPDLSAAVEANPLRDRLVGLQMLALFRTGRQAEATRAFQVHRDRLAEELGLEPGDQLIDLDRRIVAGDRSLLLTESPGRSLRGYRLGEQLGEGAFAMVYRGTQPTLGRDVAVKVIRAELANRPEFIRRFEAEAHLVARLEHPRIVPLYDYWREPDRAYLVFRFLRGGTLEARLTQSGPLSLDEALQLTDHVGSALAIAHEAGIVHRDVKPANVFLDESGNYYLGDFGIALEATDLSDPTAALSAGSPAYAAPEQLRRETIGPPADVHGLGVSLYEALTARLPFPDAVNQADLLQRQLNEPVPSILNYRADLPSEIDEVLSRATAKEPSARYQSVGELVDALAHIVSSTSDESPFPVAARPGTRTAVTGGAERNPYKGLRAFTEADAVDFRGRERLVDRLIELLSRSDNSGRIAAAVGPSGIGKSSVVRAGLLPALRRGAVDGSDQWFIATMAPGSDPFGELAAALLRVATHTPADLMSLLTDDERGIARLAKVLIPEDSDEKILLVVDQFEELFTLVDDDQIRRRFLDSLAHAVTDTRCPLRVVLTMRADFWDRPLRYGAFARLIEHSTVQVTALAPDELERAITEPALAAGAEFEPGLVSEIAADVADQPGGLPPLQYALTQLWEHRISGLLTKDAYRDLGGVAGALAQRAEELFGESSSEEQSAIRSVFGRLVTPGEGTEDTRRRALRDEVVTNPEAQAIVGRYGDARLLSFDTEPSTREPTVEVAHEALIREWPRLRDWLDEDRDDLRLHRHLSAAAAEWESAGRSESELYRGGRLEAAEQFANSSTVELTELESSFIEGSVAARDRAAEVERRRYRQQARDNRRLRGLLAGVGILLVLALVAGGLAVQQRGEARQTAFDAENRRLVADAVSLVPTNPEVALLLAREAWNRDRGPVTESGLLRTLTQTGPWLGLIGPGTDFLSAGWMEDGTIVGLTETDLRFFGQETGEMVDLITLPAPTRVFSVTQSQLAIDGDLVAVALTDGSVAVVQSGELAVVPVADQEITSVALSPGQGVLAAGDRTGRVTMIDLDDREVRWSAQLIDHNGYVDVLERDGLSEGQYKQLLAALSAADQNVFRSGPKDLVFDADGSLLATGGVQVKRYDPADGRLLHEMVLVAQLVETFIPYPQSGLALSLDEGRLRVVAGVNGIIELEQDLSIRSTSFIPGSRRDGTVLTPDFTVDRSGRTWFAFTNGQLVRDQPAEQPELMPELTRLPELRSLSTNTNGTELIGAGTGGIVRWSTEGRQLLGEGFHRGPNVNVSVSRDGDLVVATHFAEFESLAYDLSGPDPAPVPIGESATRMIFAGGDPLDRWVGAMGSTDVQLLDRQTLEPTGIELPIFGSLVGESFSLDGQWMARLAPEGPGNRVQVIEMPSQTPVSPVLDLSQWQGNNSAGLSASSFNVDRTQLSLSLRTGTTVIFDTGAWEPVDVIGPDNFGGAPVARFLPDGSALATRGLDGSIVLRDPITFEPVNQLEGGITGDEVFGGGPFISGDGKYLLTIRDQAPQLWDIDSGIALGTFPHDPGSTADGSDLGDRLQLVTAVGDHGVAWNLDISAWPDIACQAAGRNLTAKEWEQFGPEGEPYRATCPQWPALA